MSPINHRLYHNERYEMKISFKSSIKFMINWQHPIKDDGFSPFTTIGGLSLAERDYYFRFIAMSLFWVLIPLWYNVLSNPTRFFAFHIIIIFQLSKSMQDFFYFLKIFYINHKIVINFTMYLVKLLWPIIIAI